MSDLLQSLLSGGIKPADAIRITNAIRSDIASVPPAVAATSTSATTVVNNYLLDTSRPTTFSGPIETQQAAVFAGDSQFSGPMTIGGEVMWGGMARTPTPVSTVGALSVIGGDLHFQPLQMAVLNDFGLGKPQRIGLSAAPPSTASVLSAVTVAASTSTVTVPNSVSFTPTIQTLSYVHAAVGSVGAGTTYSVLSTLSEIATTTKTVSYPTAFKLDTETCTITASATSSITYIDSVTLVKQPRTCLNSVTTSSAPTSYFNVVTGGTVALTGSSATFVNGVSVNTAATTVSAGGGGAISAGFFEPNTTP